MLTSRSSKFNDARRRTRSVRRMLTRMLATRALTRMLARMIIRSCLAIAPACPSARLPPLLPA